MFFSSILKTPWCVSWYGSIFIQCAGHLLGQLIMCIHTLQFWEYFPYCLFHFSSLCFFWFIFLGPFLWLWCLWTVSFCPFASFLALPFSDPFIELSLFSCSVSNSSFLFVFWKFFVVGSYSCFMVNFFFFNFFTEDVNDFLFKGLLLVQVSSVVFSSSWEVHFTVKFTPFKYNF